MTSTDRAPHAALPGAALAAAVAAPGSPLLRAVLHLDGSRSDEVALKTRTGSAWRALTYRALRRRTAGLAHYLRDRGIESGDRVAVLAQPGDACVTALLGVLRAAATIVPLDRSLTHRELAEILRDSGAAALLVCPEHAPAVEALRQAAPALRFAAVLDDAMLWTLDSAAAGIIPTDVEQHFDVAAVVYTSGTTGRPKGVVLTHANLWSQVQGLLGTQTIGPGDVFLSILPLSHMLEVTCGLLAPLATGARICYSPTLHPHEVAELIQRERVSRMIVVPLFLRLLKKSIEAQVRGQAAPVQHAFRAARLVAGYLPSTPLRRRLFRTVHNRLGGNLAAFYCGGAPLDDDTASFFELMGFSVYQGYGLTETSPVVTMNAPGARRRGSVGRPLPGVTVRIAGDATGEVLVTGPCVMREYHGDPVSTADVLDADGVFHTGDLGRLDADGFLYITGRAKNLLVLDSGKKVQPEEVEQVIDASELVAEVCVLSRVAANGRPCVWAVVVPSEQAEARFPEPRALRAALAEEIADRVQAVAPYKRPVGVTVHAEPLPKTSTRKVLRAQVAAQLSTTESGD